MDVAGGLSYDVYDLNNRETTHGSRRMAGVQRLSPCHRRQPLSGMSARWERYNIHTVVVVITIVYHFFMACLVVLWVVFVRGACRKIDGKGEEFLTHTAIVM